MKTIKKIVMVITALLSITMTHAQIKNAKTETVKVYGNCGMCKATIEKAGNLKKEAKVDWNENTQMATIKYDAKKTNPDEILKRIALVGYDSDKFLAPDAVYDNLHGCCQYDRLAKTPVATEMKTESAIPENHNNHAAHAETPLAEQAKENQLKPVFETYFLLKDALVKTDGKAASAVAKDLSASLKAIKMDQLPMDAHMVWMKVMKELKEDASHISETQDVKHQRDHFMTLSQSVYELMKVSKTGTPTYYQFCPMANGGKGANWLSKENEIKNPYYGSQMLTCGKTIETIQ
jgi:hypothetical protein